jgi:hypothetical protein
VRRRLAVREVAEHHAHQNVGSANDGLTGADRGVTHDAVQVGHKPILPARCRPSNPDPGSAATSGFFRQNCHLHDFYAGGIRFGVCVDEEPELIVDERGARLGAVVKVGGELVYHYDFGDDWEHRIVVESAIANGSDVIICADGARACPPEDCGGPPGYKNLLRVLADPNDEEHASMKQWVGRRFESERFEPAALNKRLATLSRRLARGRR